MPSAWNKKRGLRYRKRFDAYRVLRPFFRERGGMMVNVLVSLVLIFGALTVLHQLVVSSANNLLASEARVQVNQAAHNIAEIKRVKPVEEVEYAGEWTSLEEHPSLETAMTDGDYIYYRAEKEEPGESLIIVEIDVQRRSADGEVLAETSMRVERHADGAGTGGD